MNLLYVLPLLVGLGFAFFAVRRITRRSALRRQKKRRRGHFEVSGMQGFLPSKSKRSQMRTDDDPTTVMERISVTRPETPADATENKPK